MKIVFLSYLHGFGGAEKQNIMLANAMAERGHNVTLISISVNNNCYVLDNQVKYLYLPDRKQNILYIVTRYQDIKKVLKEIRPDITVNFWFQSAYMTALMHKSICGKIIYSERGDPGDKEYHGILGIIRKWALPHIDGFIFQSKGAQNYFDKKVQQKSTIIPNPIFINAENFPKLKKRRKVIVTVGRLHPQKNQELLIDAFSMITDDFPDYILEIYGEGKLKEELQRKINKLKLTNRIFLKGINTEIHNFIYDASLFVLSSNYEGLPNTLLEAMALGIPCISTDCRPGGAREIITNNENGIIVEVGNKNKLAFAMKKVLSDDRIMEMYSIKGKISSKRYETKKIYQEWDDFLTQIKDN